MMRKLTLKKARELKYGDIVHLTGQFNVDGSCQRWKVNGKVKTWKRNPKRVQVPVKHGFYNYGDIDEDNMHLLHLECNCTNSKR